MNWLRQYMQMAELLSDLDMRTRFIINRMENAIANHEFEKARFYSDEERKERNNIDQLLCGSYVARFYWQRLRHLRVIQAAVAVRNVKKGYRISPPPGNSLRNLAEFFCSPKTMDLVVNPILSDLYVEYCDALQEGREAKALWVRMRGYWSFWTALSLYRVVKLAADIWTGAVGIKK